MPESTYLIWSNEHAMWWRPARFGYTAHIDEAGRYAASEAERIVAGATLDGQLSTERTNPYTGETYREFSEVVVLAPEVENHRG